MHLSGFVPALRSVRREIVQSIWSPRFLVLGICLPLVAYLGYMFTGIGGGTDRSIGGIGWPSYFMVSMAAFGVMSAAVGIAGAPGRGVPGAAYGGAAGAGEERTRPRLLARIITAIVLALPPLVLLGLAGALDGVHLPGVEWVTFIVLLWLGALPFVALGLLLGHILDTDLGDITVLSILTALAILGGLFQPIVTFPPALAALAHVLPSFHLADLGWTVIALDTVDPVDVLVLAGYTVAIGAVAIWLKRNEDARVGDRG
jgi:ABC-2 type transport system permease protein